MTGEQPGAAQIVRAVAELLRSNELRTFDRRVAANLLDLVARELDDGPAAAQRHRQALAELGVADDAGLCDLIDEARSDAALLARATAEIRRQTWDAVRIANPAYVAPYDDPITAREPIPE